MSKLNEMLCQIRERTTPEQSQFIENNMAIVDYIYELLDKKNMNSSDLAKAMGKMPAEISKWLSGSYNFSLQELSEMAVVFGKPVIIPAGFMATASD